MKQVLFLIFINILAGCSGNAGLPKFRTTMPPSLSSHGEPLASEAVRVEHKVLPWWTVSGLKTSFILGFNDTGSTRTEGRRVGDIRSRDVVLSNYEFNVVRCAWKFDGTGRRPSCANIHRVDAMALAKFPIDRARSDLSAQAGKAGVGVVGDVRCFAEQSRRDRDDSAHLWCEGVAIVISEGPSTPTVDIGPDPAAPIDYEPDMAATRLVLHVDGSVGVLGRKPIVTSTLGLRYRPLEIGFYIIDLGRESIVPKAGGPVGLGLSVLGRIALGRSRFDGIAGLSAVAVGMNGATNPDFDGLYQGFVGLAYQTSWRVYGGQPFFQLRVGIARGSDFAKTTTPTLDLHVGLSSREKR